MDTNSCVKCGSNKLMKNIKIFEQGHGAVQRKLSIAIPTSNRLLFNTYEKGIIHAQICGNCGDIDLSVENFRELWDAYNK